MIIDKIRDFFKVGVATPIPNTPAVQNAWDAYAGKFKPTLLPSRTDPSGADNLSIPLIGEIVNISTSYLLGDGVELDVQGEGNEDAQAWLNSFLTRSKADRTIQKLALNGAVVGHLFAKIIINEDGMPSRFQVINSALVTVETDPRDCESALSYTVQWESRDPQNRPTRHKEVTARDQDSAGWTISEYEAAGSGQFTLLSSVAWDFPFAPVFDCQNLTNPITYLGTPDVSATVIAQNEAINSVVSMNARLLRNHSHPKTIISGLKGQKMDWLTDGAVSLPEGTTVTSLEMAASGSAGLLDLYNTLRSEIHTTTRTPEIASGKLENIGPISGAALSILYRPLEQKTSEKRAHLGEMLEDLCEKALFLAGFDSCEVECIFPDTAPKNALEQRQVAVIDSSLGVSRETILRGLGYDADIEAEQVGASGGLSESGTVGKQVSRDAAVRSELPPATALAP